jgi:lambda family phage tail tape measure protein
MAASLKQIGSLRVQASIFEGRGDERKVTDSLEQELRTLQSFQDSIRSGASKPTLTPAQIKNLFLDPAVVDSITKELGDKFGRLKQTLSLASFQAAKGRDFSDLIVPADTPELVRARIAALQKTLDAAKLQLPPVFTEEERTRGAANFRKFQEQLEQQVTTARAAGSEQEQLAGQFKVAELAAQGAFKTLEEYNRALGFVEATTREAVQARGERAFVDFADGIKEENEALRAQVALIGQGDAVISAEGDLLQAVAAARKAGVTITESSIEALRQELVERNKLRASLQDTATRDKVIADLQREIDLLDESNSAREVLVELHRIENDLLEAGIKLSDQERSRVAALLEEKQALEARNEVVRAAVGDMDEFELRSRAISQALGEERISAEQAAAQVRKLREEHLAFGTSAADGFERGGLKVVDTMNDVASVAETAVVNSFSAAEDALVSFVTTGKIEVADLVNALIADFTRLAVRMAAQGIFKLIFGGPAAAFSPDFAPTDTGVPLESFARGGITPRGLSVVGEQGPELLFDPSGGHQVIPNDQAMGMMSPNVSVPAPIVQVQIVNVTDPNMVAKEIASGRADRAIVNRVGANQAAIDKARVS